VRIDGNPSISRQVVPEASGAARQASPAPRAQGQPEGVELLSSQQARVDRAAAVPEIDEKAVAEARELIRTGRLDTPEAIRGAAEAILDRGV
jgi:hypothetical protein